MPEPAYDAQSCGGDVTARADAGGTQDTGPSRAPAVEARADGDRVVVAVRGEFDLEVSGELERALRAALSASARGVDLDLGGVEFCDCSVLNVLLGLRNRALESSKTVVIRDTSPAAERLLTLTGTLPLFAHRTRGDEGTAHPPARDGASHDGAAQGLRTEVVQLRRAMQTRPTIDLARGILMASFGLNAEEAWKVLVIASQHTNTKLHHLARQLVATVNGDSLSEDVQKHMAAAVTKVRAAS
ncbi:ANTAR domain-containing protein [Streptomyces sp. HUAS ZL42]|uniref:ANTAR domain-containing protein n=1 Tax=Streptomyces sp. HUAS ZL42 TaxID=3231715 RepID=UPI00345EF2EF